MSSTSTPTLDGSMSRCENCDKRPSVSHYSWCIQCIGNSTDLQYDPVYGTLELTPAETPSLENSPAPEDNTPTTLAMNALFFLVFLLGIFIAIVMFA